MPCQLAQQRMTLSDLEWPFHPSCAISAVAELLVSYVAECSDGCGCCCWFQSSNDTSHPADDDNGDDERDESDGVNNMYVFEGKDYSKEPSAADCHAFQQLADGICLCTTNTTINNNNTNNNSPMWAPRL